MTPEEFISAYEKALASQDWQTVSPLIADSACVTFSSGIVHNGKDKVQSAFEHNFATIKSEHYEMKNVVWLKKESTFAVYTFEYHWSGYINEKLISGNGVGTSVIVKEDESWKLLTEHLGKK